MRPGQHAEMARANPGAEAVVMAPGGDAQFVPKERARCGRAAVHARVGQRGISVHSDPKRERREVR